MSSQEVPMEEVDRAIGQRLLASVDASRSPPIYNGRRRSSILQKLGLLIRACIEVPPNSIPVSPRTRQEANTEHVSPRRTVRLQTVTLPAVLRREPIGVESMKGEPGKFKLSLVIDSAAPTVLRHTNSKGRMQDGCAISIGQGMGQIAMLDIILRGKSRQVSLMLGSEKEEASPHQISVIEVSSFTGNDGRIVEARVLSQKIMWGGRELEYLEIFDQPGQEGKSRLDNTDCVICLTTRRNTVMLPCRHMCACIECAETLSTTNGICPICRQTFSNMMTITEEPPADPPHKTQKMTGD